MMNLLIALAVAAFAQSEPVENKGRAPEPPRQEASAPATPYEDPEGKGVPALPQASAPAPQPAQPAAQTAEKEPACDGSLYGICKSFAFRALRAARAAAQQQAAAAGEAKPAETPAGQTHAPAPATPARVEPAYANEEGKGQRIPESAPTRETPRASENPEGKGRTEPAPRSQSQPQTAPRYEHEEGKGRY